VAKRKKRQNDSDPITSNVEQESTVTGNQDKKQNKKKNK